MKEELMQYLSKLMVLAVVTALGVALAIVPAHAQSGSRVLVDIPFDFSVENTTLKAGNYMIDEPQPGIISFSSRDGKERQFALTSLGDPDKQIHEPHLVFIRYGSEAFLEKVFFSADEECRALSESSRERALIKNETSGAELSLLVQPAR